MSKLDQFTQKRLSVFIQKFRDKTGQLPTSNDLEQGGFEQETVKQALKSKIVEEFYVTLSNGTIVKGYKVC